MTTPSEQAAIDRAIEKQKAKRIAQLKEETEQMARLVGQQETLAEQGRASIAVQDALAENTEKYKERLLELIKATGDFSALTDDQIAKLNEWNISTANAGAASAELNESIKQGRKILEEYNEVQEDAIQHGLGFLGFSKDLVKQQKIMAKRFELIATNIKKMGVLKYMGELGKQVFAGLAAKGQELIMTMFTIAFSVDKATSAFKKQTGIIDTKYTKAIETSYEDLRKYSVTIEMASQAQGALTQGVTDYMFAQPAAQNAMLKTTEVFAAQGIAVEATSAAMQTSQKMLGETGAQSAVTAREIKAMAVEIGMAPEEVLKNFAAAGPQLAKFGGNAKQIFKELQVQARLTGLSIDRMMDITAQFDTFEGAATAAGKMNAMLGGPFVSALEMIEATDPVERFEKLRGSLNAAGKDFETMGYYEKIAIAEAMGLKDVGELALVMRGRTDLLAGASQKSAESIEKEAEQAANMQDVMTQLKAIFLEMAPVFMELINNFLRPLLETLRDNIGLVKIFGYVLMASFAVKTVMTFGSAILGLGKGIKGLINKARGLKDVGNNLDQIRGGGPGGGGAGGGGGPGATQTLAFMAGLAIVILAVGKALEMSKGGQGMIQFGIGIGLMFAGVAKAMGYLKGVRDFGKKMMALSIGLSAVTVALAVLFSQAGPAQLVAFVAFAAGFAVFAFAMVGASKLLQDKRAQAGWAALVAGLSAIAIALGMMFSQMTGAKSHMETLNQLVSFDWANLAKIEDAAVPMETLATAVNKLTPSEGALTALSEFMKSLTPSVITGLEKMAQSFKVMAEAASELGQMPEMAFTTEAAAGGAAAIPAASRKGGALERKIDELIDAIGNMPAPLGGTVAIPVGGNKIKVAEVEIPITMEMDGQAMAHILHKELVKIGKE